MVDLIESDFKKAISFLGLAGVQDDAMLDFAILISLYYYELFFITRLIPDA